MTNIQMQQLAITAASMIEANMTESKRQLMKLSSIWQSIKPDTTDTQHQTHHEPHTDTLAVQTTNLTTSEEKSENEPHSEPQSATKSTTDNTTVKGKRTYKSHGVITDEQIIEAHKQGLRVADIAKHYYVSETTVYNRLKTLSSMGMITRRYNECNSPNNAKEPDTQSDDGESV